MTDMHDDRSATDRSDSARPDPVRPDTAPPPGAAPPLGTAPPSSGRPDPVLVRPYVGPAPNRPGRGPADAPTVIQPAIVDEPLPPPSPPPRRARLGVPPRLLILAGGLAVALAVAGWLVFSPDRHTSQPGAVLPQFTTTLPADPTNASARASASHSPSPSPSSSSASPSSASSAPSASVSAASTLAPPPAADRTGKVTAASGRCLALGGLLGIDGSPVQVSGCVDLPAQQFTLASDGTLRVSGRCAQVTGDATIHIAGCSSATAEQWRAGPSHSLVNPSTNRCLTDPGTVGATTKVTACTGGGNQSWTLP